MVRAQPGPREVQYNAFLQTGFQGIGMQICRVNIWGTYSIQRLGVHPLECAMFSIVPKIYATAVCGCYLSFCLPLATSLLPSFLPSFLLSFLLSVIRSWVLSKTVAAGEHIADLYLSCQAVQSGASRTLKQGIRPASGESLRMEVKDQIRPRVTTQK